VRLPVVRVKEQEPPVSVGDVIAPIFRFYFERTVLVDWPEKIEAGHRAASGDMSTWRKAESIVCE
jgi:hypothetical protein